MKTKLALLSFVIVSRSGREHRALASVALDHLGRVLVTAISIFFLSAAVSPSAFATQDDDQEEEMEEDDEDFSADDDDDFGGDDVFGIGDKFGYGVHDPVTDDLQPLPGSPKGGMRTPEGDIIYNKSVAGKTFNSHTVYGTVQSVVSQSLTVTPSTNPGTPAPVKGSSTAPAPAKPGGGNGFDNVADDVQRTVVIT